VSGLAALFTHPAIWRGDQLGRVASASLPTGFPALDAELPGGGWPTAALTEILPQHEGIGELRLFAPALTTLSSQRTLMWIAPPHLPYAPALIAAGIDLSRLIVVNTTKPRETLWAIEQALRSHACGAVFAWLGKTNYAALRRLQLAAEGHPTLAVLFRAPEVAAETTPAALRMALQIRGGELTAGILKRRGAALAAPIRLHPSPIIRRRKPAFEPGRHHVMDRHSSALSTARSAAISCAS
jgi:hypothetical protein